MSQSKGLPSGSVDPHFREGEQPSASRLETNDRLVRGIVGVGTTRVGYRNGKIFIQGGAPAEKEEFGIKSISGAVVTIYAGRIWIGETELAAAETPLTLNTNSFVGWEHVFASGTLTIKNFGTTFTQIAGAVRKPLYYFTYSAGTVTRDRGLHLCDVFPANWGSYP